MGRHLVCSESDIASGSMLKATVNGLDILVANVGGSYYATDDTCTHSGASLSEGTLRQEEGKGEGGGACGTIVCGWHKAEFDCATGKLSKFPAPIRDLGSYKVTVESGSLFVEV